MSAVAELLADCAARGIRLRAGAGGKLAYDGPRPAVTPDLIERLKASKQELLARLGKNGWNAHTTSATPVVANAHASSREDRPVRGGRTGSAIKLCGNGFPPIPPTVPPAAIVADPPIICPNCRRGRVLPELRRMTGGSCYECWLKTNSPADHSGPRGGTDDSIVKQLDEAPKRS